MTNRTTLCLAAMGGVFILWFLLALCPIGILAAPFRDGGASMTKVSFEEPVRRRKARLVASDPAPAVDPPVHDQARREQYPGTLVEGNAPAHLQGDSCLLSGGMDDTSFMQAAASSSSQGKGWFTRAKEEFAGLESRGLHKCAALRLRDLLRLEGPAVCRKARELVFGLLGDSSGRNARKTDSHDIAECHRWADGVLARLRSLVEPAELECGPVLPPTENMYPFGLFNAIQVSLLGGGSAPGGDSEAHSLTQDAPEHQDNDESGLLSLGQVMVVAAPVICLGCDELFDGRPLPGWFLDQVEAFERMVDRGVDVREVVELLENKLRDSQDHRMECALAPYVNGIRFRMESRDPQPNAITTAELRGSLRTRDP